MPLFKLEEYVRNFITVILQFSPEVIEWFIEIIDPDIQTRISFGNLKCYTTTTKERFSVFLVTFEVRNKLKEFTQGTTLPAWVAKRSLQ